MVRSTGFRNPPKLLLTKRTFDVFNLISVKWNLSFHIWCGHLYSIRWNALHEGAYKFFLYIDQYPGNNCVLFIELFTNRQSDTCLQLKNNHSIFIPIVAIWLWGLRNNYLFYNLLQFLTCVLYWFPTKNLDRSWTIGIGQTGRIFFLLKTTQIWVITIVVVLDQSTVTFQKGWGGGIYNLWGIRPKHSNNSKGGWYYNLCGIEINIVAMLCFISWLLICRVCSHPRRFSISITNQ